MLAGFLEDEFFVFAGAFGVGGPGAGFWEAPDADVGGVGGVPVGGVFGHVTADFDFAVVGGEEDGVGDFPFFDFFFLAVQEPLPEAEGMELCDDVVQGEGDAWGGEVFGEGEAGGVR